MFDGTVPVELEKLKQIYRSINQLSVKLGAFAADARREKYPKPVQDRIDALEAESDDIVALFGGVLTDDEQLERLLAVARRDKVNSI